MNFAPNRLLFLRESQWPKRSVSYRFASIQALSKGCSRESCDDYSPWFPLVRKIRSAALELNEAFGQLLKGIREERGFSQEKLAELCGLDRTFISLLERGKRQPSLTTLFLLGRSLSVKPSELVSRTEATNPEINPHRNSI